MSMIYNPVVGPQHAASSLPSPITWSVVSQTEVVQPDAQGRLVAGRRITFSISTGDVGTVFVPDSSYAVENVQAAIQAKVALITSVGALSGSGSTV